MIPTVNASLSLPPLALILSGRYVMKSNQINIKQINKQTNERMDKFSAGTIFFSHFKMNTNICFRETLKAEQP